MKLNIREWRKAKGVTQQAAADAVGVHVNTLIAWESDLDKMPVGAVRRIAGLLEIPTDDIFLGEPILKVENKK